MAIDAQHKSFRHRLPDERAAITHKFQVAGHEGYIHVGLYPDGRPGELFIKMSKQGSTVSGLCDTIALLFSICLQYNVPLAVLTAKFKHTRFDPAGITNNPSIREASSIMDYLARWLESKFCPDADADEYSGGRPLAENDPKPEPWTEKDSEELEARHKARVGWKEERGTISPPDPPPADVVPIGDPLNDPVLQQAIEIGSGLTAAKDPTKPNGDT